MHIEWSRVLPVMASIGIIIAIAILRNYSRTVAAITATMPVNITLGLWIAYSGDPTDRIGMITFTEGLLVGIMATVAYLIVAYIGVRAGWSILGIIAAGYAGWALCVGVLLLVQQFIKR